MTGFKRYAIYSAPPPGPLAGFAAAWLGWDAAAGRPAAHPDLPGLPRPLAEITAAPRRYGFHGTIKPPFRLAPSATAAALAAAVAKLCARLAPVRLPGLRLAPLEGFLALLPEDGQGPLGALAAAAVEGLDGFRAAADADETARRLAAGLTPAQAALLARWGYPHVMEEFRFHMTLTGPLAPAERDAVAAVLAPRLGPLLPRPFVIADLCLMGEDDDGRFHLLARYPLGGGGGGDGGGGSAGGGR
ncbi:MAG: DUF1045 domain-containing protein [Rhodobacteraceae bacterium]|nr:DUF1045 domain-containing protein [Paracoccaceae bacterium]